MTRDHSVILETVKRTDSIGERQLNSYKWEGVKQANTEALIIKQKKKSYPPQSKDLSVHWHNNII